LRKNVEDTRFLIISNCSYECKLVNSYEGTVIEDNIALDPIIFDGFPSKEVFRKRILDQSLKLLKTEELSLGVDVFLIDVEGKYNIYPIHIYDGYPGLELSPKIYTASIKILKTDNSFHFYCSSNGVSFLSDLRYLDENWLKYYFAHKRYIRVTHNVKKT
jgi:hypothetical protein